MLYGYPTLSLRIDISHYIHYYFNFYEHIVKYNILSCL